MILAFGHKIKCKAENLLESFLLLLGSPLTKSFCNIPRVLVIARNQIEPAYFSAIRFKFLIGFLKL